MDDDIFISEAEALELEKEFDIETFCICNSNNSTDMICCSKDDCEINFYHRKCAGEPPVNEEWTCFTCRGIQHPQMLSSSELPEKCVQKEQTHGKKTKRTYAYNEFSLEDAQADAINMIELSIKHLMEDSAMKLNPEFGKTVTLCLSNLENPKLRCMESVKNVCSNIITEIWPSIVTSDEKAMLNSRLEDKTALFHKIRSAPSMILKMKELFKVLEVPNGAMTMFILQFLLPKLFQVLIKKRTKEMPTAEPEKVFKLDRTEEQVLRYTAGYVCRKLSRHFKRYPRNETAKVCSEIVDSFHKSSITRTYNFLSYTKQWIDLINRGGVYEINDDVFIFFRRMELVVRQYLNDSDASLSVSKDILEKEIMNNSLVNIGFNEIVQSFDNDQLKLILLCKFVSCWIDLRMNAFSKAYMYSKKRNDSSLSRKTQKSMRKELNKENKK